MDLKDKHCTPCEEGGKPLADDRIEGFRKQISEDWDIAEGKKLKRELNFDDFEENMKLVNKLAKIAEKEGHHPDMFITYDTLEITLWTHAVGGLTENDFIMARKIDSLV